MCSRNGIGAMCATATRMAVRNGEQIPNRLAALICRPRGGSLTSDLVEYSMSVAWPQKTVEGLGP